MNMRTADKIPLNVGDLPINVLQSIIAIVSNTCPHHTNLNGYCDYNLAAGSINCGLSNHRFSQHTSLACLFCMSCKSLDNNIHECRCDTNYTPHETTKMTLVPTNK